MLRFRIHFLAGFLALPSLLPAATNVAINASLTGFMQENGGTYAPVGAPINANIDSIDLYSYLESENMIVTTSSSGTGVGNITVAKSLAWDTPSILTLNASGGVTFSASVASSGNGGLTINAANDVDIDSDVGGDGFGLTINGRTLTVAGGATLAGTGSIGAPSTLQNGAALSGALAFTDGLTLDSGSTLDAGLGSPGGTIFSVSEGTLTAPGTSAAVTINLSNQGGFAPGTYVILDATGASLRNFNASDFALGTLVAGTELSEYSLSVAGSDLDLTVSAIPEPSTCASILGMLAFGAAAVREMRRTRRP